MQKRLIYVTTNITGPFDDDKYFILLNRKVSDEDIRNIKQDKMPGFKLSWKYNKDAELWAKYNAWNNQFTRLMSPEGDIGQYM